jgi:hypothetical protein
MLRVVNRLTIAGKVILIVDIISLTAAIVLHRYNGVPFAIISLLCLPVFLKDQG